MLAARLNRASSVMAQAGQPSSAKRYREHRRALLLARASLRFAAYASRLCRKISGIRPLLHRVRPSVAASTSRHISVT
jgi:hypothetical protein